MKINKNIITLTSLAAVAGGGTTVVSANTVDNVVADARKKGYSVDVVTNKKEVSRREELDKLVADENKRRMEEVGRIVNDIKKFEDEKLSALKDFENERARVKSDYARKLEAYKAEFDKVSRERARLVAEYEVKLKENDSVELLNKAGADKYTKDLANYEGELKEYERRVSKIESDYDVEYNAYLKKLSDYEAKKLKASMEYEKIYNDIAYKNAEARRIYLEEKAKVEAENKMLKENYEKEVADIKAANEKAKKEYEDKLAKWKAEKTRVENTAKTKDLIDSVLTGKIDELKKKGVNITVGREEVTEVDGSSGKVSEVEALAKLKELSKVKLAELDRAEKVKVSGDATNKEYSDRVNVVKTELGKLSNLSVNYTNGGVVGNVSSDIIELNKKLEQAKALNKLASKLNELNAKISEHDNGIVSKLKAAGVSDAEGVYNKKTVVSASEFTGELEALKKNESLSDAEIDSFIGKVNTKLDTAKATVDKAIKAAKSGGTGEALDDAEYDKKYAEFQEKVKEYNKESDMFINSPMDNISEFFRQHKEVFDKDITKLRNKTKMRYVSSTGDVTFYKPRPYDPIFRNTGNFFLYTASAKDKFWEESNNMELGVIPSEKEGLDIQYSRVKLGKGATLTVEYEIPDGEELKDKDRDRVVMYSENNGNKEIKPVKKLRYTFRNVGSYEPDGSLVMLLTNNLASNFIAYFNNSNKENRADVVHDHLIDKADIINTYHEKPLIQYEYDVEMLDANGNPLKRGVKYYENDKLIIKPVNKGVENNYEGGVVSVGLTTNGTNMLTFGKIGRTKPNDWDIRTDEHSGNRVTISDISKYTTYSYRFLPLDWLKNGSEFKYAALSESESYEENNLKEKPTFNYTRKNAPIQTLETIPNSTSLDIPVKTPTPSSFTTINPVKVVYKYKETFTEKEPTQLPTKPIPDETKVHYKPLPKEPVPTIPPGKTTIPNTPPVPPTKQAMPLPPTPPTENQAPRPTTSPILNLPPLPMKPWEPDQPIEPRLPKTINLTMTLNEYTLKPSKLSHASSLTIKHKLASYANSFQLRKL